MFLHYLKIAWRNLLKYKTQSVITVLGLAIGFAAFALSAYWHYWEHSFDTFHPDWEKTYAITTSGLLETRGAKHADLNQLHEEAENYIVNLPEVESYCMISVEAYSADGNERTWMGMRVDSAFFKLFTCDLIDGTYYGNTYDGNSVILTQSMAEYFFGNGPCVGKQFKVNEERSFTIAGVMNNYPGNTNFKFDYLILGYPEYQGRIKRLPTYIHVKYNADIQLLRDKISSYKIKQEDTRFEKYSEWTFNLCPLPDIHITCSPNLDTRFRNITILAVAGLFTFISALMNLLVLFISRQRAKLRYNSLYRTIGASTKGLIGKGMVELFLSLLFAFILSMACVELIYPLYSDYTRLDNYGIYENFVQYLSKSQLINISFSLWGVCSSLFLLLSLMPVYFLVKRKTKERKFSISDLLIIGQIFIGSLFLVAAFAFYFQYQYTRNKDKGLDPENIWQIDVGFVAAHEKNPDHYVRILRNSPYIDEVTTLTAPIFSTLRQYYCSYVTSLPIYGEEDDQATDNIVVVEPNFLSFFGMRMESGEWLSEDGIPQYVINQTGAEMINLTTDFSKVYDSSGTDRSRFRISGILKDYHYFPIQYPLEKTFFHIPTEREKAELVLKTPYIYIKVAPENKEHALAFAKQHYQDFSKDEVAPGKQFQYLPDIMRELNVADIYMSRIFLTLALVCILISSLGIYLLVALSTEQRKKEMAIRIINGAAFTDILKLFLNRYLVLTLMANIVSLSLGYLFVYRWLQTYAYHFQLSFLMFVLVLLVTIIIVFFSVTTQVIRVLKMNPAEVVKSE